MNRILPEIVVEAYEKTNVEPINNSWVEVIEGRKCACALSAVFISGDVEERFSLLYNAHFPEKVIASTLELDEQYVDGFMHGFDGFKCLAPSDNWELGYEDGKSAFESVERSTRKFLR